MDQHAEKPDDDFGEFLELENRLRQVRPRTPYVNLATITSEVELPATTLLEPKLRTVTHSWRYVGSMVASLVAGLLIGAGGMFYGIRQNGFGGLESNPSIAVNHEDSSKDGSVAMDATGSVPSNGGALAWMQPSSDIENILGESFGSEFHEILRAGQHLRIRKSKMISISSHESNSNPNEQPWLDADPGFSSEALPSTSARLMRDLLKGREAH